MSFSYTSMAYPFHETLIAQTSKEYKVDKTKALEAIEDCFANVSELLQVDPDLVYAIIQSGLYPDTTTATGSGGTRPSRAGPAPGPGPGPGLAPGQTDTIEYMGTTIPRFFPDAPLMNRDPDKYTLGMTTQELEALVDKAAYLYYNYEGGGITDNTFDAFEYILNKRLAASKKRRDKIGAPPIDKLRIALPYPMASLEKIRPGTTKFREWLRDKPDGSRVFWSHKLDGNSGLIVYHEGKPKSAYTRGDGTTGGNVNHLLKYLSLPTIKGDHKDIVVRGEFVITRSAFKEKYQSTHSNPRSFITSQVNSGHHLPSMADIQFLAYEIVDSPGKKSKPATIPNQFKTLTELGFLVPVHGIMDNTNELPYLMLYRNEREKSEYDIDGLVIAYSNEHPDQNRKIAFKAQLDEDIRASKIIDIQWNVSRHGRYIPVGIFEAVYIQGIRIHRATLFNANHVREWHVGQGTTIKVARSGDVIPQIKHIDLDPTIEPIYPPMDDDNPSWHWNNKNIELDDIEGNRIVHIKRMEYFFETIEVPRLKYKTLEKLYDAGFDTLEKLTNSTAQDLIKIKGIGKVTAQALSEGIHSTLQQTRLDRFIVASSTLGVGLGRILIKKLLRVYPDICQDSTDRIRETLTRIKVPGLGPKRIAQVAEEFPKFIEFLYSLNKDDIAIAIENDKRRIEKLRHPNSMIEGRRFVLTGFGLAVDYGIEDFIEDNLGVIEKKVTDNVAAVIVGNASAITGKMIEADRLGLPMYTLEEFYRLYGV